MILHIQLVTIRGYFKKVGRKKVILKQEHISSGRTPTTEALNSIKSLNLILDSKGINLKDYNILHKK